MNTKTTDIFSEKFEREILIGSGALGTCLRRMAATGSAPVELLNLHAPQTVLSLHRQYREAGSDILLTNTFGANHLALEDSGASNLCRSVNEAGVALARQAAERNLMVWASVGPLDLGLRLADFADEQLRAWYQEQCSALAAADALVLETFVNKREAHAALTAATATGLPVVFQVGNPGGGTGQWERLDTLIGLAHEFGVRAIGANCLHPTDIRRILGYIGKNTALPLTSAPNAGNARIERGVVTYEFSPNDMAATGRDLAAMGVSVIGGCCGTTPEHIRALVAHVERTIAIRQPVTVRVIKPASKPARDIAPVNPIRELIGSSRFLLSVEIRADRTRSLDQITAGARAAAAAGADLFSVPDNPGATVGRDAMVTAAHLQATLKVPSISHFTATQANLTKLHSNLIGCWDIGLRGLLAVTGDAPSMGHLGQLSHRVKDIRSSVELMRLIDELRHGRIINGEVLADPPDFCLGCAVGQATEPQRRWLSMKIEAGAEFVFSQPVFQTADFERLQTALSGGRPVRLFPGILPLTSRNNAAFFAAGKIPGIVVPDALMQGFARYDKRDDQRRFGMEYTLKLADELARMATGIYLIMPFGAGAVEDTAGILQVCRAAADR